MTEYTRPSKESYYLDIARTVSQRSTCLRKHWGAVIVKDDVIVSTGYNGAPRGCTNCTDKGVCWRAEHNIPRGTRYELCLTGDTPIRMESGESKPIRDLVGHDFTVRARNYVRANEAGSNATATACNVRKTGEATTLVTVKVELPETEGERVATIRCTMEHLFLVQSVFYSDPRPHWQSAGMLRAGDYLAGDIYVSPHSTMSMSMKILSVDVETLDEPVDVYDMEIPVFHNFPIAVGNACVIYSHNCAANGVHAEGNAIIAAARERMIGSTMYIYGWDVERREMVHNPDSCQMCKRMIINAGIDEVIFALPEETVAPDRPADMEYVFTVRKTKDWIREGAVEPSVDGY